MFVLIIIIKSMKLKILKTQQQFLKLSVSNAKIEKF